MNKIIKIYEHQNMNFDVEFTKDGFFNATKIAKQFGKQASKWLENKDTQEYISELIEYHNRKQKIAIDCASKGLSYKDLVIVKKGGDIESQGTWLHPKLAIPFARWLKPHFAIWCDEQIEEILKQQSENAVPKVTHKKYQIALEVAKTTGEMLRLSDTSKLRMMYKICETYQVDSQFLPYYVEQSPTGSLTQLLKDFGLSSVWTAQKLNLKLEELGILEKMTRKSRSASSGEKQFWSLTSKGLEFGKNESSPQNPRETQPLYFKDSFLELMKLI